MNHSEMEGVTVKGEGTFTPPPSPCGDDRCGYVLRFRPDGTEIGWEVEHAHDCPEGE